MKAGSGASWLILALAILSAPWSDAGESLTLREAFQDHFVDEAVLATAKVAAAGSAAAEAGWHPLFNGRDLSGWTVRCKPGDQGKNFWQADAGTILCDSLGRPDHDYCWLVSDREYGDFELRLKFQAYTNSPGNSGIQFRSRYDTNDQGGWLNGPQVDIHPPASQSWRTGLIYDETRGEQRWVWPSLPDWNIGAAHKPAGHVFKYANDGDGWNDLVIVARGTHIKTVVNGVVCTDWDGAGILDNAAHRARNVGRKGHFALQLHAKDQLRIRFKDIVLRELDRGGASGSKSSALHSSQTAAYILATQSGEPGPAPGTRDHQP